jgi:hypothetical protein
LQVTLVSQVSYILSENVDHYQDKLFLLKDRFDIKVYASETIDNLTNLLNLVVLIKESSNKETYAKYGLYLLGVGLGILALIRYFTTGAAMLEGTKLINDHGVAVLFRSKEIILFAEHMQ